MASGTARSVHWTASSAARIPKAPMARGRSSSAAWKSCVQAAAVTPRSVSPAPMAPHGGVTAVVVGDPSGGGDALIRARRSRSGVKRCVVRSRSTKTTPSRPRVNTRRVRVSRVRSRSASRPPSASTSAAFGARRSARGRSRSTSGPTLSGAVGSSHSSSEGRRPASTASARSAGRSASTMTTRLGEARATVGLSSSRARRKPRTADRSWAS
mmetsp:Transcript_1280/g.4958  ORF Transcript_1280/g.4958 Transcript_1280/m.4958 type:complete len:212 (+) Transcript_1280:199-834(+)